MSAYGKKTIKVAILDLYAGVANQGMRCLREILNQFGEMNNLDLQWDEFEVRLENQVPGMDYDVYISSGGPGSPLESEGTAWENAYFDWISDISRYNAKESNIQKKQVFFICHSFQLACRYFKLAEVAPRKSTAFGVFPVHYVSDAQSEPVFDGLRDPFYAVDSRDFQVIQPRHNRLRELGASILAIEKSRPHVPFERAIMALRFNEQMIGTQFHPEADAVGMSLYLQTEEKKKTVIENHGYEKWESMIDHLNDPDKIMYTYARILPNFLQHAVNRLVPVEV